MELFLTGKQVVVTGGTRGIGLACAAAFLAEGASVTVVGSSESSIEQAKNSLGGSHAARLTTLCVDLSRDDERKKLAPVLESADILVNNAGAIPGGGLDTIDNDAWRKAWNLKVFGYIDVTRLALPYMLAREEGVIVNIIGIFGALPSYDYLCGSAGNAALIAFTKATGAHSARKGVRVLGLNPGATRTDRLEILYKSRALARFGDEGRWPELLDQLPFGRLAEPQEMADLVLFLVSRRASYLSGVVIDADGGNMYAG